MTHLQASLFLGLFLGTSSVSAQQTGVAVAPKPGAASIGIAVRSVAPKPTCETPPQDAGGEIASLPEMVFGREFNQLVCVRHADGKTEKWSATVPNGVPSTDGSAIAYWDQNTQELHVHIVSSNADMLVESVPGAKLRALVWSMKGHLLSYVLAPANPAGIRSFDLDSGKKNLLSGSFVDAVASPDGEHVIGVGFEGVEELALATGKRDKVATVKEAAAAKYSANGKYLGILGNESLAQQNAPPAAANAATGSTEDDEPDCTGGSFALILQDTKTKQMRDVPYPKGFDTVLDFDLSPDENSAAVTFGVVGCDYPGDRAQIFLVSLSDLKATPISPEDQLSVKPVWSPDGKVIVYSDYAGSESPLVLFDLATRKTTRITKPGQFGPDEWLSWR